MNKWGESSLAHVTTCDALLDTWESTSVSSGCFAHGCMRWGVIPCALVCEICSDVHTGACMDISEKDDGVVVSQAQIPVFIS